NDLNGLELADILFNDNGYPGYTLGGNGIVLTHSLTGYATINLPIDVQANAVSIGNVQLNGALSGTGPIT
ncbi:hypothetical protein JZU54_04660, partial [bacterium]|nr:hypothetical protein [bacterium]